MNDKTVIAYFCAQCGAAVRRQWRNNSSTLCRKCKLKAIRNENPNYKIEVLEKRKKTNLKKYGNEFAQRTQLVKDKQQKTASNWTKEFKDDVRDRTKTTVLKKYGVDCTLKTEKAKKAIKNSRTKEVFQKISDAWHNKTDEDIKSINEKKIETNMKKFGVKWYSQTEESRKAIEKTCLKKYGFPSASQSPDVQRKIRKRLEYDDSYFDSQLELEFYKRLKEDNVKFELHKQYPECYYRNHVTFVDFYLIDTDEWIELKGAQFFDENMKPRFPWKDEEAETLWKRKFEFLRSRDVKIITKINKEFVEVD